MKRLAVIALMLTGCDPYVRESEAQAIAEQHATTQSQMLSIRIAELEREVDALQEQLNTTRNVALGTSRVVDEVADQVSNNAKVANQNAVNDMTARGACGYYPAWRDPVTGTFYGPRPIPCTEADLKK